MPSAELLGHVLVLPHREHFLSLLVRMRTALGKVAVQDPVSFLVGEVSRDPGASRLILFLPFARGSALPSWKRVIGDGLLNRAPQPWSRAL